MTDPFFQRFDRWVAAFDTVEFVGDPSDDEHTENVVTLLTQLVFVQTLSDVGVIDAEWLRETWERHERERGHEDRQAVLSGFFEAVTAEVRAYCDVKHFTRDVYAEVEQSDANVELLSQTVVAVLGLDATQDCADTTALTSEDFSTIDEDVFGHIYEQYLAEGRDGRGIYYTPRYVSRSLVADTVGVQLDDIATRFENAVVTESWDDAMAAATEFTEFRVLDPACGTGSFLVAAFDVIRDEYDRLFAFLDDQRQSRRRDSDEGTRPDTAVDDGIERIDTLQRRLGCIEDERGETILRERRLVSKLVLRHLHAVDLDRHALDIAKLNIWLEAVERAPASYCSDPDDRRSDASVGGRTLSPELELNFGCGDSLVGLPDERVRTTLHEQYDAELEQVLHARDTAVEDLSNRDVLGRAAKVLTQIRTDLDSMFEECVEETQSSDALLDETTPFYWPLQFWHVYRDADGFDCVVGNPPWVIEGNPHTKEFLAETYAYQAGQPDLYRYFLEKSLAVTAGRLGMVTPNTWLSIPGARDLRRVLLDTARLSKIAFVPDSAFVGVGQNSIAVVVDTRGPSTLGESSGDDHPEIRVGTLGTDGAFRQQRTVPASSIEPPAYHVNPYVGTDEYAISAKMAAGATTLREIADLTVGYQLYHKSIHTAGQITDEVFHSAQKEHAGYVPDTRSSALTRYHLDRSATRYVDTTAEFFRIPPDRFLDGEKLLVREVPSKRETGLIATRSETKRLFPKSVISVVLTDDEYDYEHLLGLLNSRLLYLQSLVTGEKMSQGLFPRVSLTQLRGLAIDGTTQLTPLVEELEALSERQHCFRRAWNRRVETLDTEGRSLGQTLRTDKAAIRNGDTETWTVASSVDPGGDAAELETAYEAFTVVGDTETPSVVVYGLDSTVEEELLRVEFRNRELLQMGYLSLANLFDSRTNVDTLEHVLNKTIVPTAGESTVDPAVDVIRAVEREVDDSTENVDTRASTRTDIVAIETAMRDAQMELDATVFDRYGLTRDEARTVLDVLDIREMVIEETLEKLDRLRAVGDRR
ncbi:MULTISPECIES: Eco57I restriction-modification methylase domain-containing protein [Haloferax]|uniref:site-specific DNA-methyltransferase (adenine-specific) n=2 Tax=Haloferax TaxID=2251 RepID=A0A6G1Z013_9EURY|nr:MULTISPECIES: N-6 DNA methylase [Haloferax]KAB1187340.1 N-6 DNA methylase [Haloferax sp. CBA1149]MRW79987.1 N-6 DNA methylase [Haloferax marinisediminis]